MPFIKNYWQVLRDAVLTPRVSSAKVDAQLRQSNLSLKVPVFWLLGKAQSGKTSIVHAITGSTKAEIGNGFQPCTRTASLYAFPDDATCLLRFLDTRGLGEAGYDPTDPPVGAPLVGIHHPLGTYKRISFGSMFVDYWALDCHKRYKPCRKIK